MTFYSYPYQKKYPLELLNFVLFYLIGLQIILFQEKYCIDQENLLVRNLFLQLNLSIYVLMRNVLLEFSHIVHLSFYDLI